MSVAEMQSEQRKAVFRFPLGTFIVDSKYSLDKILGEGACGVVARGRTSKGEKVAVKKLVKVFSHPVTAMRSLRELRIHSLLKHDNIVHLHDIMSIPSNQRENFDEVYVSVDLMHTDLHTVIASGQHLGDDHRAYFMYQIFKALAYLHSANVIHRDLKPANCLINEDATLKICDFGLATAANNLPAEESEEAGESNMTAYVVTRWYRAPEVILDRTTYGASVDVWAAGLILAELLHGKPFLRGRNEMHQIQLILDLIGRPTDEQISRIGNARAKRYVERYNFPPFKPIASFFPKSNIQAVDLLEKLLRFDANERLTAQQALEHPFFSGLREKDTEKLAETKLSKTEFDKTTAADVAGIRRAIWEEARRFHPEMPSADAVVQPFKSASPTIASPMITRSPMKTSVALPAHVPVPAPAVASALLPSVVTGFAPPPRPSSDHYAMEVEASSVEIHQQAAAPPVSAAAAARMAAAANASDVEAMAVVEGANTDSNNAVCARGAQSEIEECAAAPTCAADNEVANAPVADNIALSSTTPGNAVTTATTSGGDGATGAGRTAMSCAANAGPQPANCTQSSPNELPGAPNACNSANEDVEIAANALESRRNSADTSEKWAPAPPNSPQQPGANAREGAVQLQRVAQAMMCACNGGSEAPNHCEIPNSEAAASDAVHPPVTPMPPLMESPPLCRARTTISPAEYVGASLDSPSAPTPLPPLVPSRSVDSVPDLLSPASSVLSTPMPPLLESPVAAAMPSVYSPGLGIARPR